MTDLRKLARDKLCQIRLPGCNGHAETTVLCHVRMSGISGMGLKAPDLLGAWGCSACHDVCDRRLRPPEGMTLNDVRLAFLEGVMRTQAKLIEDGVIKW